MYKLEGFLVPVFFRYLKVAKIDQNGANHLEDSPVFGTPLDPCFLNIFSSTELLVKKTGVPERVRRGQIDFWGHPPLYQFLQLIVK